MAGLVVAAVVGIIVGLAAGIAWSRRSAPSATRPAHSAQPQTSNDGTGPILRSAVEHLEIGVVIVGVDGSIVYRNRAASVHHGTQAGLIIDEHLRALLTEVDAGRGTRRLVELQGPPKTWLAINAEPLPDAGAVMTLQDITERMRTDAMRTDFVTNISHELKTPVGAVAVLAEALLGQDDPEVVNRLADHLIDESHRAVRTIDDLLKLSQIESARPSDGIVDLNAVVHLAMSRGRAVDAGRGVEIAAFDPPGPVFVRGDERQLVSAIGNLVENAVKYSHTGDVVQVRTRLDAHAVEVMVTDQGVGIPTRDLDRIFERFYRVDKARSRETGGTGLGLAIVRHVATNHGGVVLVSSQEGEGSAFVFRLPATLLVDAPDPST